MAAWCSGCGPASAMVALLAAMLLAGSWAHLLLRASCNEDQAPSVCVPTTPPHMVGESDAVHVTAPALCEVMQDEIDTLRRQLLLAEQTTRHTQGEHQKMMRNFFLLEKGRGSSAGGEHARAPRSGSDGNGL